MIDGNYAIISYTYDEEDENAIYPRENYSSLEIGMTKCTIVTLEYGVDYLKAEELKKNWQRADLYMKRNGLVSGMNDFDTDNEIFEKEIEDTQKEIDENRQEAKRIEKAEKALEKRIELFYDES